MGDCSTLTSSCFYVQAIEFFAENPEYYVNRARACMELAMNEQAYSDLQKCLELDSTHGVANALIQQFNQAKKPMFNGRRFLKT